MRSGKLTRPKRNGLKQLGKWVPGWKFGYRSFLTQVSAGGSGLQIS